MTEHTLQLECIAQFRNDYERFGKGTIVPIVNELAAKRKDVVIKKGASDLIVFFKFKTLFIELKVDRNTQSDDQIEFQKLVVSLGFKYFIARSLNEFKNILLKEQPTV
jgi:hypothetical protein